MVTLDSSSPTHQPSGRCRERSRSTARFSVRSRSDAAGRAVFFPRSVVALTSSPFRHEPRGTRADYLGTLESGWWAGVPHGRKFLKRALRLAATPATLALRFGRF